MSSLALSAAKKVLQGQAKAYEPEDPHYEFITAPNGKKKRVKRGVPPGLTKKEEKALRKIRKRAHYLDKGMNLCGFRVGWTFWIGFIPGLGDIVDAGLNYSLVVRPARKLEIPKTVLSKMLANNAVSAGVGIVPIFGSVVLAAYKANSRNAHLLEAYLTVRGAENIANGTAPSQANVATSVAHGGAVVVPPTTHASTSTMPAPPALPPRKTAGAV